eukprot:EG_transcript_27247
MAIEDPLQAKPEATQAAGDGAAKEGASSSAGSPSIASRVAQTAGFSPKVRINDTFDEVAPSHSLDVAEPVPESQLKRRWRSTPKKTVAVSAMMLLVGTSFLVGGLACLFACDEKGKGGAYSGLGGLLLLPGCYSGFILLQYLRGVPGFSPNQLPHFE